MSSPLYDRILKAFGLGQSAAKAKSVPPRQIGRPAQSFGTRPATVSPVDQQRIVEEVTRKMGRLGELVYSLLRPNGKSLTADIKGEVKAAMEVASQLEHEQIQRQRLAEDRRNQLMQGLAKPISRSVGNSGGSPPGREEAAASQPDEPGSGWVTLDIGGRKIRVRDNDPIVTGEMIPVKSSNVHSIGYEFNYEEPQLGTLKVRYLSKGKGKRSGGGPLYYYLKVPPALFRSFQIAASKGKFVWDKLRVRGTVTGKQFDYQFADTGETDYIPRKAVRIGNEDWYKRRSYTNSANKTAMSQLKDEFLRRVPNRGVPNRGK